MPVVWEYSRLNITHNMLSKRKLNKLCTGGFVRGWDDPRLLTLAGLRRRGAPPEAINNFVKSIGVSRNENLISIQLLDHHIRDVLNRSAPRAMAVLHPLKVVLTNYPEGDSEELSATTFPQRAGDATTYKVPFSRVIYIDWSDFRLVDEKDYYGLAPGKSVLLRYAFPITCKEAVKNDAGAPPPPRQWRLHARPPTHRFLCFPPPQPAPRPHSSLLGGSSPLSLHHFSTSTHLHP